MVLIINPIQALVTVGYLEDGCDYDNLYDAYLDNDPVVHVTTQLNHFDSFVIAKNKYFVGGFDNCTDAQTGIVGVNRSVWRQLEDETVITINAIESAQSVISISNFEIFGGQDTSFAGVGGISIQGNSSVIFNNSEIRNNYGDLGGGISIYGANAKLELNSTNVRNNISDGSGAGIYCEAGSEVVIQNESNIRSNLSYDNGGGVFAISQCKITLATGDNNPISTIRNGIVGNSARNFGGGIYAGSGSKIFITGNAMHPASVSLNSTFVSRIENTGGGIYATDLGTTVKATNARIDLNSSQRFGAGLAMDNQAVIVMDRFDTPCWDNDKCSSLSDNYTIEGNSGAAAGGFYNAATGLISQTYISGNQSNSSSVFSIGNSAYVRLEGNLLVNNTSNSQPFSAELFALYGIPNNGGILDFLYNTVSNNNTDNIFKLFGQDSQQTLFALHSIIDGTGEILAKTGNINPLATFGCLIVHENQSLEGSIFQALVLNALFVDKANGDYHLSSNSPAIDFCDDSITNGTKNDLNGNSRGIDDENSQNFIGIYDLGAYEYQGNDLIFINGFD